MKPCCLLLICLSCSLIGVYCPRFLNESEPYLLLAGVLVILLLSLGTRRCLPVTTSTKSTTSSTTTTIASPGIGPQCNDGYTLYPGPGRSFCFRYVTMTRSWDDAQRACQMENANLLVLDNESLMPFSEFLTQRDPVAGSSWLIAKPLWVQGEPNTPNDCMVLIVLGREGRLADQPCSEGEFYVCQHF